MKINGKSPKKQKRMPLAAWIGFCLGAVLLVFNGYTLSKYIFEREQEPLYVARNFYFESDMLAAPSNGIYPKYELQEGTDSIEFTLKNYPDELRRSEVDISYRVDLSKDGTTVKSETGVMSGRDANGQENACDKVIRFDNLAAGTYVATATATSPYTSVLQAAFTVVESEKKINWSVSDAAGSPVLRLTVSTEDYSGNITISWPSDVLPDNTDRLLRSASGSSHTVSFEKDSEYTFQFFKTNPSENYSSGFSVSGSN